MSEMSEMSEMELVSRVNALEQNQVTIRKDVEFVQREVRDISGAEIDLADTEEIATLEKELVDCRKRIYSMEQSLLREDAISQDEKCLVMMYRFIKKRGGNEGTPTMQLRADSNGFMEMGFE